MGDKISRFWYVVIIITRKSSLLVLLLNYFVKYRLQPPIMFSMPYYIVAGNMYCVANRSYQDFPQCHGQDLPQVSSATMKERPLYHCDHNKTNHRPFSSTLLNNAFSNDANH